MRFAIKALYISIVGMSSICSISAFQEWAWVYKKKFSSDEIQRNTDKKEMIWSQVHVHPFTQLIFSWNAQRPEHGFLTFFAQVRDARTGKWGDWHTMFDWGKMVQRSYKHEGVHALSDYLHVRLEVDNAQLADGFRIKALVRYGASLSSLKGFAVASSNYKYFVSETDNNELLSLSSAHIKQVPLYSQFSVNHPRADSLCSPTSVSMLVGFLCKKQVDPLLIAQGVYDEGLGIYGSWPFNNASAFEHSNEKAWFWTIRCNSFTAIHTQLMRGIPTIVSVRGPLPGGAAAYKNGHLLVVVGWDNTTHEVLCHDPAFVSEQQKVTRYKLKDFLVAWERSRRLAYCAELRT